MIVNLCYLVLSLITAYTLTTSINIFRKTSSLILVMPIIIIYAWSIYGAWSWIPMKLNGESHYYEEEMMAVNIDEYYLMSLIIYSLFIIVFTTFLIKSLDNHCCKCTGIIDYRRDLKKSVNHLGKSKLYYVLLYFLLFVFVFFSLKNINEAISQGVSAYQLSRTDSVVGALGSVVIFTGDIFMLLSIVLLFAKNNIFKKILVITPVLIYFITNLLLGNRNTLLCGLIEVLVLAVELYGIKKVLSLKNISICIFALFSILLVSALRSLTVDDILAGNFSVDFFEILSSAGNSSEKYAAQISMYFVLKCNVPLTYGSSFFTLVSTLIPSYFGVKRPDDIYIYYVMQTIHEMPDVGMTINHATGWYLNFGILGVVMGAMLWAYVLKSLYSRRYKFHYFIGCVIFCSVSIQMIRGSIESYKGVLLLDTLIPICLVYLCMRNSTMCGIKYHKHNVQS